MSKPDPIERLRTRKAAFRTTRWSVVLAAQGNDSGQSSSASLEILCRQYWAPLYAYARHQGHSPHDAEDLTQGFFARLLEKGWLEAVAPEKGRFRSFLLMAMKRYLSNERERSRAQKRGGGMDVVSFDTELTESRIQGGGDALPPEALYDRHWALALLDNTMQRLRSEHESVGKLAEYTHLKPCLTAARGEIPYEELAASLGIDPASARSSVHRLRYRFRAIFREEVADTLADPADLEEEMHAVIAALGQS